MQCRIIAFLLLLLLLLLLPLHDTLLPKSSHTNPHVVSSSPSFSLSPTHTHTHHFHLARFIYVQALNCKFRFPSTKAIFLSATFHSSSLPFFCLATTSLLILYFLYFFCYVDYDYSVCFEGTGRKTAIKQANYNHYGHLDQCCLLCPVQETYYQVFGN